MMTWPLFAALLSGFAWSGLDVARKSLARDLKPTLVATGLTLGMAVLFGGWAAGSGGTVHLAHYALPGALSILFSTGVQLLILESMRRSELSRTIPLLSFTPVATILFGILVLRELPSGPQWFGVILVLVGALALSLGGSGSRRSLLDAGSAPMLGAALLISAAAPFDKLAVAAGSVPLHGFIQSVGVGILLLAYIAARGDMRRLGQAFVQRPALLGGAVVALAALGLQYTAYSGAMVGVVEAVKRVVGLILALAAGRLIFHEPITTGKVVSVTIMAAGVTLMLL